MFISENTSIKENSKFNSDIANPEPLNRAKNGYHTAYKILYELNVSRIHALCHRLSGSKGNAEQYKQDVFVRPGKIYILSVVIAASLHGFRELQLIHFLKTSEQSEDKYPGFLI